MHFQEIKYYYYDEMKHPVAVVVKDQNPFDSQYPNRKFLSSSIFVEFAMNLQSFVEFLL